MGRGGLALAICVVLVGGLIAVAKLRGSPIDKDPDPEGGGIETPIEDPKGTLVPETILPVNITLECEYPSKLEDKAPDGTVVMSVVKAQMGTVLGGEGYLDIPDGWIKKCSLEDLKSEPGKLPGKAFYRFEVPRDDTYYFSIHARWFDDCGDSIYFRVDNLPYKSVQDTHGKKRSGGRYNWAWHPVRDGYDLKAFSLKKGSHVVEINTKEDGPSLDQILISTDANTPVGNAVTDVMPQNSPKSEKANTVSTTK